jgi:hypothetical protein
MACAGHPEGEVRPYDSSSQTKEGEQRAHHFLVEKSSAGPPATTCSCPSLPMLHPMTG